VQYAHGMGVAMSHEQAQSAVTAFRTTYKKVPVFWRWLGNAFRTAISGQTATGFRLTIKLEQNMLTVELPSGRKLYYKDAQITPEGDLAYWGQNSFTHKWELIRTYGARICENIVQAIARDILAHGLLAADEAGLKIVGHVHDEIICESPQDRAEIGLRQLREHMTRTPLWARGLVLGAEGYISKRYRKD